MDGLDRFVTAQAVNFRLARDEVTAGRKVSHWMWYVFPQLACLGRSDRARFYGLSGAEEAAAYLAHPVLGPRLRDMAARMLTHREQEAAAILGPVDALKLRSCMTLFAALPEADPVFAEVLKAFYGGEGCPLTLAALKAERG